MIAGGTEAVGLEELQEDLVHSVMIGNYDRITSNHLYDVSMTEGETFQDLARKLQEERDDFNARRATGDPSADGPWGFGKSPHNSPFDDPNAPDYGSNPQEDAA